MRKLMIANRGEIAVRIIRAAREMRITPVAVYSQADRRALHVQLAAEAYCIGRAPAVESYLNQAAILEAARTAGADAIHPGYGFLAENAPFAEACVAAGLLYVGPPPEAIRLMGDKREAKRLMRQTGIPVVPGYDGDEQSDERLEFEAAKIGYPLLIKAAAGGGGKGMRIVERVENFLEELAGARREARSAFGDERVLLERLLRGARHVEIQVLADHHGTTLALGERECSIQRRHQKVIEETPSTAVNADLRGRMSRLAIRVADAVGYRNAGTVEFLLAEDGSVYFLEMNTRLQVEHPITEEVYGVDLVRLQIEIARGQALTLRQEELTPRGHAIECRIYAEDPSAGYLPSTGRIHLFRPSEGPGIRNDVGTYSGDEITPFYDPLLAKLTVHAATRDAAIERMQQALSGSSVLGVSDNIPLLQAVLGHDEFLRGRIDTDFLERVYPQPPSAGDPPALVLFAATAFALLRQAEVPAPTFRWSSFGAWRQGRQAMSYRWQVNNRTYEVNASHATADGDDWRMELEGVAFYGEIAWGASGRVILRGGAQVDALSVAGDSTSVFVGAAGKGWRLMRPRPLSLEDREPSRDDGARGLTSPMPGIVVKVNVREGETVEAHQILLIIEAMKMEHAIEAPAAGIVLRLHYQTGDLVPAGAKLVDIGRGEQGTEKASI